MKKLVMTGQLFGTNGSPGCLFVVRSVPGGYEAVVYSHLANHAVAEAERGTLAEIVEWLDGVSDY